MDLGGGDDLGMTQGRLLLLTTNSLLLTGSLTSNTNSWSKQILYAIWIMLLFNKYGVSVWEDEEVLDMDGHDSSKKMNILNAIKLYTEE